ncbi:MAG: Plug domain-containing protein, partial [Sphingorhabdus sp.]|uniref:TonB-dependent receptor plug domain-containing protein n=1 Tax=Sphingorhabdus sp. TaxID=1902408 RepID=UPI003C9D19DF
MKRYRPFLSLPLVALAQPAFAQTCDAQCEELNNIEQDLVHYGHRIERPADLPVSIISADDLIIVTGGLPNPKSDITEDSATVRLPQLPGERLENALLAVNGLQQFRRSDARSANPTSQGVTLRGLGGNASSRALLFLDDVPQADPFGGWVSWPGYDALNLASVRIRKGGGQL